MSKDRMTRVLRGIYSDIVLGNGFFVPDDKIDLLCEWLNEYADALEGHWVRKADSEEKEKSLRKVKEIRSFMTAVKKGRDSDGVSVVPKAEGEEEK